MKKRKEKGVEGGLGWWCWGKKGGGKEEIEVRRKCKIIPGKGKEFNKLGLLVSLMDL